MAKHCTAGGEEGLLGCNEAETERLYRGITARPDKATAIPTLVSLLESADNTVRALALTALQVGYGVNLGPNPSATTVPAEAFEALLYHLRHMRAGEAAQLVAIATLAATLNGRVEEVFAAIAPHGSPNMMAGFYERLMIYGRLQQLPRLERVAASGASLAVAALKAPSAVPDSEWSEADRRTLCAWQLPYLGHADKAIVATVSPQLARCVGAELDQLVARAATVFAEGQMSVPVVVAIGYACRPFDEAISGACNRAMVLMGDVAADERLRPFLRGAALQTLSRTAPDALTAARLAGTYIDHPEAPLAGAAATALRIIARPARVAQRYPG